MHYVICGFPRAGSTLLYNCLRHAVKNARTYEKEISAANVLDAKGNVITKRPMDIFKCNEIADKVDARFIITIRDPRDVLTSIHANSEGKFKVNWNYSLKTSSKGVCGKTNGLLDYYKQLDLVPDPIFVYYEDLVTNATATQIYLETQLPDLEFKGDFYDFYSQKLPEKLTHQLNGIRPINDNNVGRWKNYPERIKQQFKECPELFEMLLELGYEEDKSWIENL